MELSYFLAQLFGLTMMIFSLIALFRPRVISAIMQEKPSSLAMLLAGFVGIVAGLAIVLSHNIWEMSWVGVVTLFGWAALLKGMVYVICPDTMLSTANNVLAGKTRRRVVLLLAFVFGCYLAYNGFALGA